MPLSNKPKQKADYRLEMLDDELLLFHPADKTVMYCNQTASLVWQLCNGQRTGQEIANLLCQAYPETAETITGDVEATLQQFASHGAIELLP